MRMTTEIAQNCKLSAALTGFKLGRKRHEAGSGGRRGRNRHVRSATPFWQRECRWSSSRRTAKKVDAGPARRRSRRRSTARSPPSSFTSRTGSRTTDAPMLLCTKCYDNAAVLAKLPPGADLIPIQNGFDPQLHAFGHEWEGIASFVSECEPDRPHTRITRQGRTAHRQAVPRPAAVSRGESGDRECLLSPGRGVAGGGSSASSKSPTSTRSSTPSSCTTRPSRHSPRPRGSTTANSSRCRQPARLFFALLQENYRILTAAGIALGKVGPFHPRTVAWILRRKWLAGIMARCFEPSLRGTYCSMAGEIQKGRTEIDNYNGHLIRLADETGTPGPLNQAVYDLVSTMTEARANPHRKVLETLAINLAAQPLIANRAA